MKKEGKPVMSLKQLEKIAKAFGAPAIEPAIDFSNTKIAFAGKNDEELKKTAWLFKMMNNRHLVNIGSKLGLLGTKIPLPFFKTAVKSTIFKQFCGGTTLLESLPAIEHLHELNVDSVLDYGVEAKESEEDFNRTMNENLRAIDFAATLPSVPVISSKITGLARFGLLEKISSNKTLTTEERGEFKNVLKRVDAICHHAAERGMSVFIDAEETWIQPAVDLLANRMMKRYNKEKVVVFNTFQMYCTDRLAYIAESFDLAKSQGFLLGAKLVRGAYLEKERKRAEEMGYPSPIQPNKAATDHDYDLGIQFCIENYEQIAVCNASHNAESNLRMAALISKKNLPKNHPHLRFCQLLGMSDNITFNLAKAGYNVAKYMVYGQVKEVTPYLIRRTQENTSMTGDLSRELTLVLKEVKRRGL
ncbi:MAG: proline dehydrogenase family protein [Saprospiraceae bacterium]|nr:proline dehydrogenase family protein [Saprospiraceae bacterium]MCF8250181.1 proline dehydrogenase family protein [Saprospiraceae bacterium]MCF8279444.1 proline dehydrogenase family protein [Bacteroidales bacterium]MCF8311235.1 proline dehydrogenase family protein [Saprospiraceae bacterium]MCF8440385.1 proline dehydrogenase family protein [Saprospiraceae bacterium]